MRALVLGAGGVVGQHMMLQAPFYIQPVYCRTTESVAYTGINLEDEDATLELLKEVQPSVVVNLAGENRVDVVENNPTATAEINVCVPDLLATWCDKNDSHLIQVSTQGVFSGNHPPYSYKDKPDPITEYGRQKAAAEAMIQKHYNWTIARLTFVLGVRPFDIGRRNPVEDMLTSQEQLQVNDRWFSPCFAEDAASKLWWLAGNRLRGINHIGTPVRTNRYEIATTLVQSFEGMGYKIMGVSHSHFPEIAPRPQDTTWAQGSLHNLNLSDGLRRIVRSWSDNTRTKS